MSLFLHDAIRNLDSSIVNIIGDIIDNIICEDKDGSAVTIDKTAVNTEIIKLQAEYDAIKYQRDRKLDYPTLAEQFDLLWHAIDSDTLDKTSDFYTTLKAVKDAHPKG